MAFGVTPAGEITKEQTLLSIARLPIAAGKLITKGLVCELNSSGFLIVSPHTSPSVDVNHFVALSTIDNTAGTNATLTAPVAVRGHFVTVTSDGTINPGDKVKISTSTDGRVIRFVPGTDDNNLAVGIYKVKEGGAISVGAATPYLESFTDNENFPPVVCGTGDVIEIELY